MAGLGVLLVILGIGSLVLPMLNIQFQIMRLLDDYQPIAGIAIAAIGVLLVVLGTRRRSTTVIVPAQEPPAAPPAS